MSPVDAHLGSLRVAHGTVFAPMEGVTEPALRAEMAARGGLGLLCTEFVRISRAPLADTLLRRAVVKQVDEAGQPLPLSVQVMGNEAAKMAEAAARVAELGADVVDINLGCPMPRVVRKGVGAAMLKDPVLLGEVLAAMREATRGRSLLSAKIRAGFDDAADVVRIAEVVQRAGADFIAVHPRRRADFYEGVADWRIVRVLAEELSIPVVGNGDVWYAEDALRMEAETGCAAVMIGRPALRNPWIFEQIAALRVGATPPEPSGEDIFAWLCRLDEMFAGLSNRLGRLKEYARWLGRALRDSSSFFPAALRARERDEFLRIAEAAFVGREHDALDLAACTPTSRRLERSGSALAATEPAATELAATEFAVSLPISST